MMFFVVVHFFPLSSVFAFVLSYLYVLCEVGGAWLFFEPGECTPSCPVGRPNHVVPVLCPALVSGRSRERLLSV